MSGRFDGVKVDESPELSMDNIKISLSVPGSEWRTKRSFTSIMERRAVLIVYILECIHIPFPLLLLLISGHT